MQFIRSKHILLVLMLLAWGVHLSAQNSACFSRTFDGSDYLTEVSWSTANNCFFTAGVERYFGSDSLVYWSLDLRKWDRTLSKANRKILKWPSESITIGGSGSLENGDFMVWGKIWDKKDNIWPFLTRLNSDLDTLWTLRIPGFRYAQINDMIETENGELAGTGFLQRYNGNINVLFIKTAAEGELLVLDSIVKTPQQLRGHAIVPRPGGGYIIGGEYRYDWIADRKRYLAAVDSSGQLEWEKILQPYNNLFHETVNDLVITRDSLFLAVGTFNSEPKIQPSQGWVAKYNWNGDQLWDTEIGLEASLESVKKVTVTPQGDFVMVGEYTPDTSYPRAFISKVREDGKYLWFRTYETDPKRWCYLYGIVPHPDDGGFVLSGWGFEHFTKPSDAWMLRVDSMGLMQDCYQYPIPPVPQDTTVGVQVWPNPVTSVLHYDFFNPDDAQLAQAQLFDMAGKRISSFLIKPGTGEVSLSALKPGLYYLRITQDNGRELYAGKLVVVR